MKGVEVGQFDFVSLEDIFLDTNKQKKVFE